MWDCAARQRWRQERNGRQPHPGGEEYGMQLGMIGLGRMGGNMTERLLRGGPQVVAYDPNPGAGAAAPNPRAAAAARTKGATEASGLADLVGKLSPPRVVWMMLPSGAPVDDSIAALLPLLQEGSILVDGGNSNFHDTLRRSTLLLGHGIELVDCGTSGGIWGLENGYCLMVGGSVEALHRLGPGPRTLAPPGGLGPGGPRPARPLRQDGAQRDRIRAARGVRRGL